MAQAPGTIDAEGNYYWPNGMGRNPLKRLGSWKVGPLQSPTGSVRGVPQMTAAERATVQATLDALSAVFRATPESQKMTGYWMNEVRNFYYPFPAELPPSHTEKTHPLRFNSGFFPFYLEEALKNGQYVLLGPGETESVYFEFNLLPGNLQRRIVLTEVHPNEFKEEIYLKPRVTGEYKGFPVYEEQALLVIRAGRDPWAPVSYARATRLAAALFDKDRKSADDRLAGLKKKNEEVQSPAYEEQMRAHLEKYSGSFKTTNPEKWKGRVAGMERELKYNRDKAAREADPQRDKDGSWYWNPVDAQAEAKRRLAALTPADEKAPACFLKAGREAAHARYAIDGSIERYTGQPDCEPLVTGNHDYFDLKLSRTAPQILWVNSLGRCGKVVNGQLTPTWKPVEGKVAHGCARHPVLWEQMDWTKVGALVAKP
jgi:hypothetical protein